MRIHLLLSSILLLGFAAQSIGATIPHPRLYFTSDDLPRIREFGFSAEETLAEAQMTVKFFGGKEITFPLPPQQPGTLEEPPGFDYKKFGHYPYWTMMSRNIQNRMQSLALAYASTGKKEYARRAVDYALALSKWSVWTDLDYGKKTCLDTCHLTFGVATVYDACYDFMTDDERKTVHEAIIALGLEPLLRDMEPAVEHNMQLLRAAALGTGALAIIDEADRGQAYLDSAKSYFKWFLDSRAESPNIESMLYLSYGLDTGIAFADVLHRATGDDSLVAHPYLDQVIRMAIYFQCPKASGLVNFSDCSIANYFGVIAKVLNRSLDHGPAGWYLNKSKLTFDKGWSGAVYGGPIGEIESPDGWPTSAVFRPIDWVSLRSGWTENDTMLAMVSSNTKMGHNHRDQNSIILNHAGEWLITDIGYKSFEGGAKSFYGQNTVGHNSLLVDGEGQDKLGGGKVTSFFTSGVFDYTVGDASGSYDPTRLSKFLRRIVQVKPDYYIMLDEVASEGTPRNFEILLHTDKAGKYLTNNCSPMQTGDWGSFSDLTIARGKASVSVRSMHPKGRIIKLTEYEGAEEYGPYVSISPAEKASAAQFVTVLLPHTGNLPHPYESELLKGDSGIGIKTLHGIYIDIVGFRTGRGISKAGDLEFLGESCYLRYGSPGTPSTYALCNGRKLSTASSTIVLADSDISIGMSGDAAETSSEKDTKVRLYTYEKPLDVKLDGRSIPFGYESDHALTILEVPAGDHRLEFEYKDGWWLHVDP